MVVIANRHRFKGASQEWRVLNTFSFLQKLLSLSLLVELVVLLVEDYTRFYL